jgi:hypothetical protein
MKKPEDNKQAPVARVSRILPQPTSTQTSFTIKESQTVHANRFYLDMRDMSKFLNKLVDLEQLSQQDVLFYKKLREFVHYQISIIPPQQRWNAVLSLMHIWKSEVRKGIRKDTKLLQGVILLAEQVLHCSTLPTHIGTIIAYDSDSSEYILYSNQWE